MRARQSSCLKEAHPKLWRLCFSLMSGNILTCKHSPCQSESLTLASLNCHSRSLFMATITIQLFESLYFDVSLFNTVVEQQYHRYPHFLAFLRHSYQLKNKNQEEVKNRTEEYFQQKFQAEPSVKLLKECSKMFWGGEPASNKKVTEEDI